MIRCTVVMPSLAERTAMREEALSSIQAQTSPPERILVVVGGKPWEARNAALDAVQTEWTAFLDDDDWLLPHHLATLTAAQEMSGADVVYAKPVILHGDHHEDWPECSWDPQRLKEGNFIPIAYLVRTALAREVGGFPPRTNDPSDWLFLRALMDAGATFEYVDMVTWVLRRHDGQSWNWR